MVDILLTYRSSGWVSIENNGTNGRSVPVAKFLQANRKHFDQVCFGDKGYALASTYAVKVDRIPRFREYAAKHGFVADYMIDGEPAMARQARFDKAAA